MSEITSCPSCQRKLQVPEALIGQDVQCPTCGATFVARVTGVVPQPSPAPASGWETQRDKDYERPDSSDRDYRRDYDDEKYTARRRDLSPHRGALILTLGLVGLLVLPFLAPVAWIMGNTDIAEIRAGRMDPEGEALTQAGRICGIIGTVMMFLTMCFCGLLFFSALAGGIS